jgi:hypothetical protein
MATGWLGWPLSLKNTDSISIDPQGCHLTALLLTSVSAQFVATSICQFLFKELAFGAEATKYVFANKFKNLIFIET